MRFSLPVPKMIAEARTQVRFKREQIPAPVDLIIEIAIFILVFLICALVLQTGAGIIFLIPIFLMSNVFSDGSAFILQEGQSPFDPEVIDAITAQMGSMPAMNIATLLATVGSIVGVIIYCRFIERRKLATMGFRRKRIIREYFVGLIIGAAMFGTAVLIAVGAGTMSYKGLAGASTLLIVMFFLGFMVQSMSEEVVFRGYFLTTLARRQHIAVAVFISSCLFGAAHLLNSNVVALGIVNIILFGCVEGIYMLKRGSIWGAAAIHLAWNFTQGNVFGISVSGMTPQPSVFLFESSTEGALINGGAFGIEAGLAASVVLVIMIVICLLMKCSDPAPRVLAGSDGGSQVLATPEAQQQQYWPPPSMPLFPPQGSPLYPPGSPLGSSSYPPESPPEPPAESPPGSPPGSPLE